MINQITNINSICHLYINQLRDKNIQKDSMRFRKNIERISQILAYEISKEFNYSSTIVKTPMGEKESKDLEDNVVISSVLRAGLPMHNGFLDVYDFAENAFISAYRKHDKSGKFEIKLEYLTSPNIDDKILILCDPMIATGASIQTALEAIKKHGSPKKIFVASIIASECGIDYINKYCKIDKIFVADIDEELSAKGYIIPGLGDAGDLCFGSKLD